MFFSNMLCCLLSESSNQRSYLKKQYSISYSLRAVVNLMFFQFLLFHSGMCMLVIADGFRRLILLFLLWFHYLISDKLTWIDPVQIWIALAPKGTGSVPQSMEKRNWNRSKRNWEIPISDQNHSAFSHLH